MTHEQRAAFGEMRALAAPLRLRVTADPEGFPVILGRLGQVEWTGHPALAVHTTHRRRFETIWAIPGVRRHQTGDTEMRALFPPEALAEVAKVIRARKRRALSPEMARNLGSRTAYRVTSGLQNEPFLAEASIPSARTVSVGQRDGWGASAGTTPGRTQNPELLTEEAR